MKIHPSSIFKAKSGFTLLEVLLSISIIGMIGAIGAPLLISEQSRNELEIAADHMVQSLRRAQTLAQNQENDSRWGVYAATSTITIFSGDSYSSRDTDFDEDYPVPESVGFSGTNEYVFTKFFGQLTSAGTTTLSLASGDSRQVVINEMGVVGKLFGDVGSEEGEGGPPDPEVGEVDYEVTIYNDWNDGFCADVEVTTDSIDPVEWEVAVDLSTYPINGEPYNVWEADWSYANETLTASGLSYNDEVSAGSPEDFGFCANRPGAPSGEVDFSVSVWLDWSAGYCASVNVTTESVEPIAWEVNIPLTTAPTNGTPYTVWNANWSFASSILTASGVSWNDEVSASSPQSFGYCANR